MMTLLFRVGLVAALSGCALLSVPANAQTTADSPADNPTAYTALRAMSKSLGKESLDRVVEVTGQGGAPQPSLWKIVLKDSAGSREIDVEGGKITAQRPLSRPPAYSTPIHLSDLNLDSSGAFDATDAQARKVKLRFDSLDYALWVNDTTGKPVWHIELLSKEGTTVGTIRVAAHDGTVISTDGRLASNSPTTGASSTPRLTPRPAVVSSTPATTPRIVYATPYPVASTPHPPTTTTTTTTTYQRTGTAGVDSDNVYAPTTSQPPVDDEQGGLFQRTGRTIDKTGHRVEGTLLRAGAKVQRFFTGHSDLDQNATPDPEDNRPD